MNSILENSLSESYSDLCQLSRKLCCQDGETILKMSPPDSSSSPEAEPVASSSVIQIGWKQNKNNLIQKQNSDQYRCVTCVHNEA